MGWRLRDDGVMGPTGADDETLAEEAKEHALAEAQRLKKYVLPRQED